MTPLHAAFLSKAKSEVTGKDLPARGRRTAQLQPDAAQRDRA
jgi:hypothetical protein